MEAKEGEWRSERPLLIMLDSDPPPGCKTLPINCFEQVIKIKQGERSTEFVPSSISLVSDEVRAY